uniref:Uncharacterized protein n=1 Tax=Salvator merianae TaxID=96440 RepID=A0A8D0B0T4_SALMN
TCSSFMGICLFCMSYIDLNFSFHYICSFHSPQPSQRNASPQNRLQERCSKECVLIFAQKKKWREKKERKLCTHSLYLQANFTLNCLKLSHSQPLRGTVGSSFSGKSLFFFQ